MITESARHRITDHEDWKDGINTFRSKTKEKLVVINKKLDHIIKILNAENRN